MARLSGDEFSAILPEAGARDAEAVDRELIAALEVNETRIAGIRANRFAFYDSASAGTVPGGTAASAQGPG